jgi:hypothetical protein
MRPLHFRCLFKNSILAFAMGVGMAAIAPRLHAASPNISPTELKTTLSQLETAANQKAIDRVLNFYNTEFASSDGVRYSTLKSALESLWKSYPDLAYSTELLDWEQTPEGWMAHTRTTITGSNMEGGRKLKLNSTIESRQFFKDQKLLRQEVIAERTILTTGDKPPEVDVNIPNTVKVGKDFDFDIIVKEPLRNDLLAGAAIAEKVEGDRYLDPSAIDLELLQAGGLFKRMKAPATPEAGWISAILIRGDGITLITQRIRYEP